VSEWRRFNVITSNGAMIGFLSNLWDGPAALADAVERGEVVPVYGEKERRLFFLNLAHVITISSE
jgi:hypothetical protein